MFSDSSFRCSVLWLQDGIQVLLGMCNYLRLLYTSQLLPRILLL